WCSMGKIYNSGNEISFQGTFKQLLVYKGKLSEAQIQEEKDKSIILSDNRNTSNVYPSNGNQISIFGIEDFYGNIWSFVDGFLVTDNGYHLTNDTANFGDIAKHVLVPAVPLMGSNNGDRVEGYFKTIEKVEGAYKYANIPNLLGGGSATHYSDYLWSHRRGQTNISLFGSVWTDGSRAGAFCLNLLGSASDSWSLVGARPIVLI
ncbi:MAG: hypothetical protein ACRCTC_07080, partial [Cetobacterium sp.]